LRQYSFVAVRIRMKNLLQRVSVRLYVVLQDVYRRNHTKDKTMTDTLKVDKPHLRARELDLTTRSLLAFTVGVRGIFMFGWRKPFLVEFVLVVGLREVSASCIGYSSNASRHAAYKTPNGLVF